MGAVEQARPKDRFFDAAARADSLGAQRDFGRHFSKHRGIVQFSFLTDAGRVRNWLEALFCAEMRREPRAWKSHRREDAKSRILSL